MLFMECILCHHPLYDKNQKACSNCNLEFGDNIKK